MIYSDGLQAFEFTFVSNGVAASRPGTVKRSVVGISLACGSIDRESQTRSLNATDKAHGALLEY